MTICLDWLFDVLLVMLLTMCLDLLFDVLLVMLLAICLDWLFEMLLVTLLAIRLDWAAVAAIAATLTTCEWLPPPLLLVVLTASA